MTVFWLLFVAVVIAGLQAALFSFSNLRHLRYTRSFSRENAHEGDRVQLVEVLRNAKIMPVPWLRVESRISRHLKFGREEAIDAAQEISADQYHKSAFFLAPFTQVTRRHEVTCLKRGHYDLSSIALTAGDLLSFSHRSIQLKLEDCALDVFPRLLGDDELDAPYTRWQGELAVKRWIMPDPFLTSGIRDYQAGDPMGDIHWRATARVGKLQVKVRDFSADPRVMVVLNIEKSQDQWGDLMDYEQENIEHGFRIAASLCLRALGAGVEAGFACNGCLLNEQGEGKGVFVPPARSAEQGNVLLTTMARTQLHREIPFTALLERMRGMRGIDILILSAYDSEPIRRQMELLRYSGASVTFMQFEGGERFVAAS